MVAPYRLNRPWIAPHVAEAKNGASDKAMTRDDRAVVVVTNAGDDCAATPCCRR
jgi:hypothetical protein